MSDDLDVALGLDGAFGRPKKRVTAVAAKTQVELKAAAADVAMNNVVPRVTHETADRTLEAASTTTPIKGLSDVSEPSPLRAPPAAFSTMQVKSPERVVRRQTASSDARYGKLISLRVPSNLFEDLERKAEEMGAKTVGQFLVAVLKIALVDQSMLAAPDPSPIYSAATGMSAAERLRATFAQKSAAEASRQMTIRLDMGSVSKLSAAAKLARVRERAPYILAIIERQLKAL